MSKLPTPEELWNGKAPEDNVTPEQFQASVQVLSEFANIDPKEVGNRESLARATRDLGLSIRRIILSCGELQITPFSYSDPRAVSSGNALINAGDFELGQKVKDNPEKSLTDKCMVIRTRKSDGSSTIAVVSANTIADWYEQSQTVSNDRFEEGHQLTNYYASVPVNIETDKAKHVTSVFAVDFRNRPTKSYYPLKDDATMDDFSGYTGVLKQLSLDLVDYIKEKKFI